LSSSGNRVSPCSQAISSQVGARASSSGRLADAGPGSAGTAATPGCGARTLASTVSTRASKPAASARWTRSSVASRLSSR